ncbi:MAG: ribonuclease PH [Anaerolineae bacterium]|nr:ribonuclease PH [Anaerolineae bacterium]MDW8103035.1 ribonuclease PH [Anaerolineae bacterium]
MRPDGRSPDKIRPVRIVPRFIKYHPGSVLIELGDTVVLCVATVEKALPGWLVGKGEGWITAEYSLLPGSTAERTPRETSGLSGRTQEIRRFIGRSLRAAFDLDKFGGHTITVDCDVLQADGGTRTAAVTGGFVAVVLALRELGQKGLIPPRGVVKTQVAAISVGVVNGQPVVDLTYEEDSVAEVDMNVVMTSRGELVEIQGTAEGKPFSRETLQMMLDMAWAGLQELFQAQREALK